MPPFTRETELYAPVKRFLEAQGYRVKGEVRDCDVVGTRGDEPPVIVELKLSFTLGAVLQGLDRLALSDHVYLAVPARRGGYGPGHPGVRRLCARLGLGLLAIHPGRTPRVEPLLDPGPPTRTRRNARRTALLLKEHVRRQGDPNGGGVGGAKLVTAYRQAALRCAAALADAPGALPVAVIRLAADAPEAGRILGRDVYGWFFREARGRYGLTEAGRRALADFAGRFGP